MRCAMPCASVASPCLRRNVGVKKEDCDTEDEDEERECCTRPRSLFGVIPRFLLDAARTRRERVSPNTDSVPVVQAEKFHACRGVHTSTQSRGTNGHMESVRCDLICCACANANNSSREERDRRGLIVALSSRPLLPSHLLHRSHADLCGACQ